MVAEYGMGTQISSRLIPADDYSVSDSTRRMVDEEQQELTDQAWRRARRLIEDNRDALETIAQELLTNEVLERETIVRIMEAHGGIPAPVQELPTGGQAARVAATERLKP
jgi:cell division protease FtsH